MISTFLTDELRGGVYIGWSNLVLCHFFNLFHEFQKVFHPGFSRPGMCDRF